LRQRGHCIGVKRLSKLWNILVADVRSFEVSDLFPATEILVTNPVFESFSSKILNRRIN
jgi:hypothetical protein